MKKPFPNLMVWILLALLLITSVITLILIATKDNDIEKKVQMSVREELRKIKVMPSREGEAGYTPIKNIDYFDGEKGADASNEQIKTAVEEYMKTQPKPVNGENGQSATETQVKSAVDSWFTVNPLKDGLTPMIQCNEEKNRWEVKYKEEDNWQLLNGKKTKCTVEVEE